MEAANPIASTFARLREAGHMAFMPFITAGDPDLKTTQAVIRELAAADVDLIEVGFPYSDPIADGPVIQASYTRALENGIQVEDIFSAFKEMVDEELPPLVAMVSFAIIFRMGVSRFLETAKAAGFSGLIVPDLPGDEAAETATAVQAAGLSLVQLIAPTTPESRTNRILASCSGFLYCISVAGTTGERSELPDELTQQLRNLKQRTDLPLAVGFGIRGPEQVDTLRGIADGVIVGSAIVRRLENSADPAQAIAGIGEFARTMVASTRK